MAALLIDAPDIEDTFRADIVLHPSEPAPKLVYADWLEERGRPNLLLRHGTLQVSYADRAAGIALARCRFAPGTAEKHFARTVCESLDGGDGWHWDTLTAGQLNLLWRMAWRYRRQIQLRAPDLAPAVLRVATWLRDQGLGVKP
jgi:uncharacterized protein (TIGR02996 family)